jgi:hypothetical protein
MKGPSKLAFLNLAHWSAIAAASASRARLPSCCQHFNRKLGEISGDRVCIQLANPAIDRGFTECVRAGLRAKRADREGCI